MLGLRVLRRTTLVVALALAIPVGGAAAAPGTVGAPGIGDPYYLDYGNGGYDVGHYGISVSYDPATDGLAGATHVVARATQRLTRFDLDFVLPVSSVTVDGTSATHRSSTHELVVTPRRAIAAGDRFDVVVRYAGHPASVSDGGISPWIRTADGAAAIGEPEIAAWWYPSNDHPRDKATYDVSIAVPKTLEAIGNGRLVSADFSGSRRVWHWRETKAMATYLAFFVVGQLDLTRSTTSAGLPVLTAVAAGGGAEADHATADLARSSEIVDFEARRWGPFPFDALGGVAVDADFGFALENQTRPTYTRSFWRAGSDVYVVVHELAHQWFGDSVSVHSWRDIWLNEGFATFTEWLWSEAHHEGTAADLFAQTYAAHPADDAFWTTTIGDPGIGREFVGAVYDRGAMTLQALRTRIGEAAFRTTMRAWAAQHRYRDGSIAQFITLAERVSRVDLGSFFWQWLYTAKRPAATRANGFPATLLGRPARRTPAPASWARIERAHALLQARSR